MKYIEWTDEYLTGISHIDQQHRDWIDQVNRIYDSISRSNSTEKQIKALQSMIEYSDNHFKQEEYLLKKNNYPYLVQHIRQHNKFRIKTVDLLEFSKTKQLSLSYDIVRYMKEWIHNHIKEVDQRYIHYIKI